MHVATPAPVRPDLVRGAPTAFAHAANLVARLLIPFALLCGNATAEEHRPKYLYRSESRPPEEIFRNGFLARGTSNNDLEEYINAGSNPENEFRFVSLTAARELNFFQNAMLRYYAQGPGQAPFVGYRYMVEASNHEYSTIRSLESAAVRFPEYAERLRATVSRYPLQQEWVALDRVENHRIVEVDVLRYVEGSVPARFETIQTIQNPYHVPGDRNGANPGPYTFYPASAPAAGRALNNTLVSGPGLLSPSFFLCFKSFDRKRSIRPACPIDTYPVDSTGKYRNEFFNVTTGTFETEQTPWITRKRQKYYSIVEDTDICSVKVGELDEQAIVITCRTDDPLKPNKFSLFVGAGWGSTTYVNTRIDSSQIKKVISSGAYRKYVLFAKDIPTTEGHNFEYLTNGSSISSIFSGNRGGWWTGLTLRHHYPTQPEF